MVELILVVATLGLLFGSFLNVVILRLPRMMEQEWVAQARETLASAPADPGPPVSLVRPNSTCPRCHTPIRPWHNIPVISWIALRGRCASCHAPISWQYPAVELLTGVLSCVCAWRFGYTPQLGAALAITWMLVAMTGIDLRVQLLPDSLTLPLMWLGLLASLEGWFANPTQSILGAAVGYGILWLVYQVHHLLTKREGMGAGDFKLLAALGAWFGVAALPGLILLSSVVGLLVAVGLMIFRGHDRSVPIAFGPYLAGAGWLVLIFGNPLHGLPVLHP